MFKLIGLKTDKLYTEQATKADVFRIMQARYPTFVSENKRGPSKVQIYPEPLKLIEE
ncbi:hypothetical protein [Weissella viridescens]|uniref:hypothetical protein n=1 Tax=Weissella viridescens TaxID=1629 RepID=UPI001639C010|nr:hypothetical protein [Weissella viridescens]